MLYLRDIIKPPAAGKPYIFCADLTTVAVVVRFCFADCNTQIALQIALVSKWGSLSEI